MKTPVVATLLVGLAVNYSAPAVAQTQPLHPTDQIRVVYAQPKEAKHQPIREALQERRILELLRSLLSPFRLPRPLTLEVKGCDGSVDAYYGDDTATLCYEYIELIHQHSPKVGTPRGLTRADALVGAIIDTLLHEVGHGIIDMLEIPVMGREEDAADFFSAYMLLQFPADDARRLIQGVGFLMASEAKAALRKPQSFKSFAGQHGLPAQRYYNLVCMAYGSNPVTFADTIVRDGLPTERAEGCVEEYEMLQRAFSKLILPHVDQAMQRSVMSRMSFNWKPLITSPDSLDALPFVE